MSLILIGQDKDLLVIAAAGSTFEVPGLSLDWTLGETVIDYYDESGASLTQGFHQPVYKLVSVKSIPETSGIIKITPTIFAEEFKIDMQFTEKTKGSMAFISLDGTLVWEKSFEGITYQENYSGSHLISGAYLLVVKIQNESFTSAYPLMKIQ